MIIPGTTALHLNLISSLSDEGFQIQPCGIDLSLKKIYKWKTSGRIDFDNSTRKLPQYEEIPFSNSLVFLPSGGYLVEFNELVQLPLNVAATLHTRSSLFRSGVTLLGGVIDPGYVGVLGALLQVWNPHGVELSLNSRLCQCVFFQLESDAPFGYSGRYQASTSMLVEEYLYES